MVSLKSYNSFGIDVLAPHFITITKMESLAELPTQQNIRVLGCGTNVLFTQQPEELIVQMSNKECEILEENDKDVVVSFGAGWIWHEVVLWALDRNLGGIENLSLVPGTIGAAPVQNIGAYGVELKDVLVRVEGFDLVNRKFISIDHQGCHFSYRDSIFKNELKNKFIIGKVSLRFQKQPVLNLEYGAIREKLKEKNYNHPTIRQVSEVVMEIRREKLPDPLVLGNAGSFFKNVNVNKQQFQLIKEKFPSIPGYDQGDGLVKIPTGWLIEQCGWKGKRIGSVGCYEKQALVLVNFGTASGAEIWSFAKQIMDSVKDKFGLEIQAEVNIW